VVEGTPASAAGLELGDRIDELDGHPFTNIGAFQQGIQGLLDSSRLNFTILIERRGHPRTITVKIPSSNK
jgi:S1-C subfamily serine protease